MRHLESERLAATAAEHAADRLGLSGPATNAVILGTGWAEAPVSCGRHHIALTDLPGFANLTSLPGHARTLSVGCVGGRDSLILSGRVHLNESPGHDPSLSAMVRLQTELLIHLGARHLVVTSAAGSLDPRIGVGDVVVVDGFVTLFAPPMPLWAGEFCSPEDVLTDSTATIARAASEHTGVRVGGYAMVRGPFFEGRRYDKAVLASTGASVVRMSVLPEACVAALYPGVAVLALAHVTNTAAEDHSHEENLRRADARSGVLSAVLSTAAGVFFES